MIDIATRFGTNLARRRKRAVVGILRSLSAMAEDAITDEVADLNSFKGVRARANNPRAKKAKAHPHPQLRADAHLRQSSRAL
jgi:hypothetical protein